MMDLVYESLQVKIMRKVKIKTKMRGEKEANLQPQSQECKNPITSLIAQRREITDLRLVRCQRGRQRLLSFAVLEVAKVECSIRSGEQETYTHSLCLSLALSLRGAITHSLKSPV